MLSSNKTYFVIQLKSRKPAGDDYEYTMVYTKDNAPRLFESVEDAEGFIYINLNKFLAKGFKEDEIEVVSVGLVLYDKQDG